METTEVIIIGGGIAGLTAAIHLSKLGYKIQLVEKNTYPKHKVCGEFISNEVLPYLNLLGVNVHHAIPISTTEFSTADGTKIRCELPLGGFSISRYTFDNMLFEKAISNGCTVIHDTVTDVDFRNELFSVKLSGDRILTAPIVIGAFGKRSNIDYKLDRQFLNRKSPWLAVKAHYSGSFPDNLVAVHNFSGGYCGVSNVGPNLINICYLADYNSFKKFKNIDEYQDQVLCNNPHLKTIFANSRIVFEKPLVISQISFEKKLPVENHILMTGDTAALIHPLCGNGMAMAMHSAKIASELITEFFNGTINRVQLESKYKRSWNRNFRRRIAAGQILSSILLRKVLSNGVLKMLMLFPSLLPIIIKSTHGKPLKISK